MKVNINDTWGYNWGEILNEARLGKTSELDNLINKLSPFVAVNLDYTTLIVLRNFKVYYWEGERRILYSKPEDKNFQWGLEVNTFGCSSNYLLPNSKEFSGLKIKENEFEFIIKNGGNVTTNELEIHKKLRIKLKPTEQDIEESFNLLNNEKYEEVLAEKSVKKDNFILAELGTFNYESKYNWFKGSAANNPSTITIYINDTNTKKLEILKQFIISQIKSKFYKNMLLKMESEMITLKNDSWLEEDSETGKLESPITINEFRERISITSIVFNEDCSSSIYCQDGDIFWGHEIQINVDNKGEYKDVNLVG